MSEEEALKKAEAAVEMGLIEKDQEEAYAKHLFETHNSINKDVDRGTAIPTDTNTNKE
tara:strand:+ start:14173 stop:14346 length:174 start_codon:yes stop_codon:yes gene_type:complete